jgi:hypothetical protein
LLREQGPTTAPTAGLLVANLVPLAGVLVLGWSVGTLLVAYWLESLVVRGVSVLEVLRAEGEDPPEAVSEIAIVGEPLDPDGENLNRRIAGAAAGMALFFTAVEGFLLPFVLGYLGSAISVTEVALCLAGLVAYHVLSYHFEYVGTGAYRRTGPLAAAKRPLRRHVVFAVVVTVGVVPTLVTGGQVGLLVVMVLTKTLLDVRGPWSVDRRAARSVSPTAEP